MDIIHKDTIKQKIETIINENNIIQLHKDTTELFQKQIEKTLQKCD